MSVTVLAIQPPVQLSAVTSISLRDLSSPPRRNASSCRAKSSGMEMAFAVGVDIGLRIGGGASFYPKSHRMSAGSLGLGSEKDRPTAGSAQRQGRETARTSITWRIPRIAIRAKPGHPTSMQKERAPEHTPLMKQY